jgi:hypothetical protein
VMRGHFGRRLFCRRCRKLQQQLLDAFEWVDNPTPALVPVEENTNIACTKRIVLIQAAVRGHNGRRLFRARCDEVTRELLDDGNSGIHAAAETTITGVQVAVNESNSVRELEKDESIEAMLRLYQTRVRSPCTLYYELLFANILSGQNARHSSPYDKFSTRSKCLHQQL